MAPQFKKLTDCPENLREAIDWLIQVRHGGDKDGLVHLAKALKKFIGEAIENAQKSLNKTREELECPFKHSKDETYCQHYQKQIEKRQKEIQDSGQLKDFDTDAEVKRLKGILTGCKSKYHNERYRDPSKQKTLMDIEDRQKKLDALIEQLEKFIGKDRNPGECNTLLTNLCTGLEKFLGFDSASKGYDGNGIVYSDLDRLCDGVMAFLKGVLESVKDDDSVTTYDLTPKKMISELPDKITEKMYSGRGDFTFAIHAMTEALNAWDKNLKRKINKVVENTSNGAINALKNRITGNIAQIEGLKTQPLESVISRLASTVIQDLDKNVQDVDYAIRKLDGPLQTMIKNYFDKIKTHVDTVIMSTTNDVMQLKVLSVNVSDELQRLEKSVKDDVMIQVDTYRKKLETDFKFINSEINIINVTLSEHVRTLKQWIAAAEKLVDEAIPQIEAILKVIQNKDDQGNKYPEAVKNKAGQLQKKADALWGAVGKAKGVLKLLVGSIKQKVKELEDVYVKTFKDLRQAAEQQVQQAQHILGGLDDQVRQDLANGVTDHIKSHIRKTITAFEEGVKRASRADDSAVFIVQQFQIGLGDHRGDAPALAAWAAQAKNGGSHLSTAIEKLNDFTKFKAILSALEVPTDDGKNFFGAIIDDLQSKLGTAIHGIKVGLETHMSNYRKYTKTKTGTIHNAIQGVLTKVDEYFQGSLKGEINKDKLNQHDYDEHSGTVETEIGKINDQGLTPFVQFESGDNEIQDDTFSTLRDNIISNLDGLIQVIEDNAGENKGIKQKLLKLKSSHFDKPGINGDSLYKIHSDLNTLQSEKLVELMNKTKTFINITIPNEGNKCANAIIRHLNAQATQTIKNINNGALELYVSKKTKELAKLRELVEKQRLEIEKTITKDCNNGVKGLMKALKMHLEANIKNLIMPHGTLDEKYEKCSALANPVEMFLDSITLYIHGQVETEIDRRNENPEADETYKNIRQIKHIVDTLLTEISNSGHFTHSLTHNLNNLSSALDRLVLADFSGKCNTLLMVIKAGLKELHGELSKAYISTYSRAFSYFDGDKDSSEKCAKVLLSIVPILTHGINKLNDSLTKGKDNWWHDKINSDNHIGKFFANSGFEVSTADSKHDGELTNSDDIKGRNINGILTEILQDADEIKHFHKCKSDQKHADSINLFDVLSCVNKHLEQYNCVRHLHIHLSREMPSSIYAMLIWLCGLEYNSVLVRLKNHIATLFDKPNVGEPKNYDAAASRHLRLPAYPQTFSARDVVTTLGDVTSQSYYVLTAILGHGHYSGIYACDFKTNREGMLYPSDMNTLLCMMFEIVKRVHHQLYFVYNQCWYDSALSGWSDCWYGRGVGGSSWQCRKLESTEKQCGIHCSNYPTCGLKSPLQSFLEDGLKGFLPHNLSSKGTNLLCSTCIQSSLGMPCKTPMGFTDIGIIASHRKKGVHLKRVVGAFCGDSTACLSKLCSQLNCLLPSAPKTLGDMFGFFHKFLDDWDHSGEHRKKAFADAVNTAYFKSHYELNDVTHMFRSTEHVKQHPSPHSESSHEAGDLYSLNSFDKVCYTSNKNCGAYMDSISSDIFGMFASKNANLYLSWILYLTDSFYNLLQRLKEECERNCAVSNTKCHVQGCDRKYCFVFKPQMDDHIGRRHTTSCNSIIHCRMTVPSLYVRGLTFGYRLNLNGQFGNDDVAKRTCKNFIEQLKIVCSGRSILSKLVHETIPNFLFAIRRPFFYTFVALWLLSFLYLIHIMVIRLDLLHIKSHLHSPSSHRIAAQSLLAAARVKALNKVLYLQP